MSLNSLPPVSQQQIDAMNQAAQKNFGISQEDLIQDIQSNSLNSEQEVVEQSAASDAESQEVQEAPAADPIVPQQQKTAYSKEENLAHLRERARKAEAEREQMARQLQSFQQKPNPSQENPFQSNLAPDDLAEGKHIAQLQQKLNMIEAESRLRHRFHDFDKVMSQSNVASLAEMFPDIARTIGNSNSDPYSQAVTAYTMIKNLGIHQDNYQEEKKIAATNAAKPRPLSSISPQQGDTPLSRANAFANGLTDDLAKTLRKEMFDAMKNR